MLNSNIAMEYFYNFKIFMFFSGLSSLLFLKDAFTTWSLVCIISFSVIMLFPFKQQMRSYLELDEEDIVLREYRKVYHTFEDDYMRSNPITKSKGQEKFLESKFECGEITEEEYLKLKEEIKSIVNSEEFLKLNYTTKKAMRKNTVAANYKKNLMKNNKKFLKGLLTKKNVFIQSELSPVNNNNPSEYNLPNIISNNQDNNYINLNNENKNYLSLKEDDSNKRKQL